MKVRIGYGLGTQGLASDRSPAAAFAGLVDALEKHGFDSLWLSERITGGAPIRSSGWRWPPAGRPG